MPPKTIIIDTVPIFPTKLQKDLMDGEVICETCKGLGVVVTPNRYGLKEDGQPRDYANLFPYKKQSIGPCPDCYNGVRKTCKFCGTPGSRGYINPENRCQCEGAEKMRQEEERKKENERYEKAEKLTIAEAIEQGIEMVYIEGLGSEYFLTSELEDEIYNRMGIDMDEDTAIYATSWTILSLNAVSIIENATDDLYEGFHVPESSIKELQDLLDEWCKGFDDQKTYWPDFKKAIIFPFCGNCERLSVKECEQTKDKEPHICLKYGKRVRHLNAHPELYKLEECLKEAKTNVSQSNK